MPVTGLQSFSFVLLLVGSGAIIAAIATDYWSISVRRSLIDLSIQQIYYQHRGLWRECTRVEIANKTVQSYDECKSRLEDLDDVKEWEWAAVIPMGASALVASLALISAPCCCNNCGGCLSFVTSLSALSSSFGVAIFAWFKHQNATGTIKIGSLINGEEFGWSFYLAVGGTLLQQLSAVAFVISRCRQYVKHRRNN